MFDRELGRIGALEDAIHMRLGATPISPTIKSVGHEKPIAGHDADRGDSRQSSSRSSGWCTHTACERQNADHRLLGVHATTTGGLIAAIARARSCGSHLIQSVCGDKAVAGATCHLHGVFGT